MRNNKTMDDINFSPSVLKIVKVKGEKVDKFQINVQVPPELMENLIKSGIINSGKRRIIQNIKKALKIIYYSEISI